MIRTERLKSATPNGHYVALIAERQTDINGRGGVNVYVVKVSVAGNDDPAPDELFDDLSEAEAHYEQERKSLAQTKNWAAQAAYDDQWGEPYYPSHNAEY